MRRPLPRGALAGPRSIAGRGFSAPLTVTGSHLCDDSLPIDDCLDQIRLELAIALAPKAARCAAGLNSPDNFSKVISAAALPPAHRRRLHWG